MHPNTVAFVEVGDPTGNDALEYAHSWTNNVMGLRSIKEEYFENGEENGDYNRCNCNGNLLKDENGKEWGHLNSSWVTRYLWVLKNTRLHLLDLRKFNGTCFQHFLIPANALALAIEVYNDFKALSLVVKALKEH